MAIRSPTIFSQTSHRSMIAADCFVVIDLKKGAFKAEHAKTRTNLGSDWRPERSWELVELPDTASESFVRTSLVQLAEVLPCASHTKESGLCAIERSLGLLASVG